MAVDLKHAGGPAPPSAGDGRRADRGLPARRHGAAGPGPRASARGQPGAGLRPDDRLGPGRAAGPGGRPRHQLHRSTGALRPIGRAGRAAGAAAEPASAISAAAGCCWPSASWPRSGAAPTGRGQVVDAAMVDGVSLLMTSDPGAARQGRWPASRAELLDTGAPFYDTYERADGEYMAVGAIEPQFCARLLDALDSTLPTLPDQWDRDGWPDMKAAIAAPSRPAPAPMGRRLHRVDACVTPVLSLAEAPPTPISTAGAPCRSTPQAQPPAHAPRPHAHPLLARRAPSRATAGAAGAARRGRGALTCSAPTVVSLSCWGAIASWTSRRRRAPGPRGRVQRRAPHERRGGRPHPDR